MFLTQEVCKVMDIYELVRLNNFMMCIWIMCHKYR